MTILLVPVELRPLVEPAAEAEAAAEAEVAAAAAAAAVLLIA